MSRSMTLRVLLMVGLVLAGCAKAPPASITPEEQAPTMAQPAAATATRVSTTVTAEPSATLAPPSRTAAPPTDTPTVEPSHTVAPTPDTPAPTKAPPTIAPPTATATMALPSDPDPAVGRALWPEVACSSCHGAQAEGNVGPRLAGTGVSFDQLLATVRLGKGQMPSFGESDVSDMTLRHIYSWLRSLARPAPTPIARPTFPTGALSELWYFVNEMRIRADFAKDLPERQASDDAGRLAIVHAYAGDGLVQADAVLAKANQALSEVPIEGVRAIISEIIAETNTVADLFRQAQAETTYPAAWSKVARAVQICRLDTLPWATQAVRDAGLTGTVRILVVDQNGRALPGAFATVLTAHTPLGVRTDSSGRATFVNVAAVPALPVKAYVDGRVYHEINANVSPGVTVDGTIAVPPLPRGGIAPAVASAAIEPAAGPGNGTVTFSVTATDPQGRLDLAEDQIFALNPDLGLAYVMRYVGGDRFQVQVRLPGLAPGRWTWYFFAVDHECNTSNVIAVGYQVAQ